MDRKETARDADPFASLRKQPILPVKQSLADDDRKIPRTASSAEDDIVVYTNGEPTLVPSLSRKHPDIAPRCAHDGHDLDRSTKTGEFNLVFLYLRKADHAMTYKGGPGTVRIQQFCDRSCLRAWIRAKQQYAGTHCLQSLNNEEIEALTPISMWAPPLPLEALACYSVSGTGLTIEQWRTYNRRESPPLRVVEDVPWKEQAHLHLVEMPAANLEPAARIPVAPHGHIMDVRTTGKTPGPQLISAARHVPPAVVVSTELGHTTQPGVFSVGGVGEFYDRAESGNAPFGLEVSEMELPPPAIAVPHPLPSITRVTAATTTTTTPTL